MPTILIADDSPVELRLTTRLFEAADDWTVVPTTSGEEALDRLDVVPIDVVLSDLVMPGGIGGLDLLEAVRSRIEPIPFVVMTSQGSEETAVEALHRGASYYVPKRRLASDVVGIVERVLETNRSSGNRRRLTSCLTRSHEEFTLPNDTALVPVFLQRVRETLEAVVAEGEIDFTRTGVAIDECLVNAIVHGNLEVGSELRGVDDEAHQRLVAERLSTVPYADRTVHVTVSISPREARFVIRDHGPGFDVSAVPDPTAPENIGTASGRGILLMRTFMDEVTYNDTGNQVTLVKTFDANESVAPTIRPNRRSESCLVTA